MKVRKVWPGSLLAPVVRWIVNENALPGNTKAKIAELQFSSEAVRSTRAFAVHWCFTSDYAFPQFYLGAVIESFR